MIESYSDGSGANYHGIGAASFIIVTNKSICHQNTIVLKDTTSNVAEYTALESAIKWACEEGYDYITCWVDSELVAKQMNNRCRVMNPMLCEMHNRLLAYIGQHNMGVTITHAPRGNVYIKQADRMNHVAIDREMLRAGHN